MTKRLYQFIFFIAFFSFNLLSSLAQRFNPLDIRSDGTEVKAIDTTVHSLPNHTTTLRSAAISTSTGVVTDAFCYGSHDGSITYTLGGGTAPYSYQWSNGVSGTVYGSCWNILSITNPGSTVLYDYQVLITLPFFTGMNADFSDVLFSDTNNTVSYSYWRESFQSGTTANFWIKLPVFNPGITYVRVSYCDGAASTQSNGTATFDYFDGFDDADFSDWTHVCNDVDYPDELCDAYITTVSGSDYAVDLHSYAHCVGNPAAVGVENTLRKSIAMPAGQYWLDVSCQFFVCLHTTCSDSSRLYSQFFIDSAFYSAFFLPKNTVCGCVISGWTQIRANGPTTYTTLPKLYELRTHVTDCGEGEMQYDNVRLRKWYVNPTVTIGPPHTLKLDSLVAGKYTLTVTDGAGTKTTQDFFVNQPDPPVINAPATCSKIPAVLTASGSSYISFNWYNTPTGGSAFQTGPTYTTDSLTNETTFYITGTGSNNCETTPRTPVQTTLLLPTKSNHCLTIYDGISPNGDGLNDDWQIQGIEGYANNHITIFDRWGVSVFEKEAYNNTKENTWKGKANQGLLKDQDLPNGTYYYEIEIDGLTKPLSGFVVINREH